MTIQIENLKIKDLKLISQIDRFDSLRSYARYLSVEPQNLSKKISSIEAALGIKLFERSAQGITITSFGLSTIKQVKDILQSIYKIEQIDGLTQSYKNDLTMCSRGYIINYLSSYFVRDFTKEHPDVRLQFIDLSPEAAEVAGRRNQVKLIFSYDDIDLGKNWSKEKVGKVPFSFFVRKDHPLNGEVSLVEIKNYKFVGFIYIEKNKLISPQLPKILGYKPSRGFDSENSMYSKNISLNSHQISYLPLITVLGELKQGEMKAIKVKGFKSVERSLYMHVHVDEVSASVNKSISATCKKALSQLKWISDDYLN